MFFVASLLFATMLSSGFQSADLGLDGIDARIVSVGDFDGDRKNDIVMLNTLQTEILILYWTDSLAL
jgi:hypothetical protein